MKKALAAATIVGVTLIIPGAAFAAEKLPGGRPPCSILWKNKAPGYDSLCNSFP